MKIRTLLLLILLTGCDEAVDGTRAYQEGRFREALDAFEVAEKAAGDNASPELLHNKAMAALLAEEFVKAEYTAEKAAARGGPEHWALRDFLRGNIAFTRCKKAEAESNKPDAKAKDFDEALAHARTAAQFWQRAAASRDDWPEARRNVERALLKLEGLKLRKEAAIQSVKMKQEKQKIEIRTDPQLPADQDSRQMASKVKPLLEELPPERIRRLLDRLKEKEKEKLALRKARQRMRRSEKEKDW